MIVKNLTVGTHRGSPRIWIQGKALTDYGWTKGTVFSIVKINSGLSLEREKLKYASAPGLHVVSGTNRRPVIDIRFARLSAIAAAITDASIEVRIDGESIAIRGVDQGSGPKGDGVPCTWCKKLACDGYCPQAVDANEVAEMITNRLPLFAADAATLRLSLADRLDHLGKAGFVRGDTLVDQVLELQTRIERELLKPTNHVTDTTQRANR